MLKLNKAKCYTIKNGGGVLEKRGVNKTKGLRMQ
jgi:hypothetical protein